MILPPTIGAAFLAGISSHPIFRRHEPGVIAFLSLLLAFFCAAVIYSLSASGYRSVVSTALSAALANVAFIAGLSASIVVYRLSPWHPLADYPGPPLAKITKWWMSYHVSQGNRHQLVTEKVPSSPCASLHKIYGPWLRTGPNEISINIPAAVRPVYGQMFRSPFYQGAPQPADSLVTTIDRVEHASRLVSWQKAFSADSLRNFRPLSQMRTAQLLDILNTESANGKPVDLSHWISLWAMDVMGDMSFSGGFETMAAGRDSEGWMALLQMGSHFIGIFGQVPWMRDIIGLIPAPAPGVTFMNLIQQKVRETKIKSPGMKMDILGIIQDDVSGGAVLSEQQAAADAAFMVVAGSDTASQASCALLRYITGDVHVQARLRAEIRAAFDGPVEDIDALTLAKLPLLDACIQESLRIVPPVPIGVPRYSGPDAYRVLNRTIPPGTTVACPTYTLHRDPNNFHNPEEFNPERWLGGGAGPHNADAFVPFSYGLGVCIGKPVALHNIKLLAASILRTFELSFPPEFDVREFDASYKEHNLWLHGSLPVVLKRLPLDEDSTCTVLV